jgi:hypothetical protein
MARKKTDTATDNGGSTTVLDREDDVEGIDLTKAKSKPIGLEFVLRGDTPLVMDHFAEKAMLDALVFKKGNTMDTESTLEVRCRKKIYRGMTEEHKDKIVIPRRNLWSCLVGAGKEVKFGGKANISNATSTKLTQFLRPLDHEYLLITPPNTGEDGEGWVPDVALGRLPGNGTANALIRPRFDKWEIKARFRFDSLLAPQMTVAILVRLFQIAGAGYGLGSHNPAHKGLNGIFDVVGISKFKIDNALQAQLDAIADEEEADLAEATTEGLKLEAHGGDGNGFNGNGDSA